VVLDLGFLQTHDIGFVMRDPVENNRQAPADGVYVVGGDLHWGGMLDYRAGSEGTMPTVPTVALRAMADRRGYARDGRGGSGLGSAKIGGWMVRTRICNGLWEKDKGGQGLTQPGINSGC
jgi:hypothetical protein